MLETANAHVSVGREQADIPPRLVLLCFSGYEALREKLSKL